MFSEAKEEDPPEPPEGLVLDDESEEKESDRVKAMPSFGVFRVQGLLLGPGFGVWGFAFEAETLGFKV